MTPQSPDQPTDQQNLDDVTLALDLRIRLLECIFAGGLHDSNAFLNRVNGEASSQNSIALRVERILTQLTTILETKPNDTIRRFVQSYDLNEPLLHLPNPMSSTNKELSGPSPSISEKTGLVFESEPDIVQLERDLREIELLDSRGFVGAGKLADGGWSTEELTTAIEGPLLECGKTLTALEQRAMTLMSRYDSFVSALSGIFISWDDILSDVENEVLQLQKSHENQQP